MRIHVNGPVLARMAGEMSRLCVVRPASPPDGVEACGSAEVARAFEEFSDARSKALSVLILELEKLSDAMTGTLADARDVEAKVVESLRSFEAQLGQR